MEEKSKDDPLAGAPPVPPTTAGGGNGGNVSPEVTNSAAGPAFDPFDPASLRLANSFLLAGSVQKALLSVPVRKPDKAWFVRAHPDEAYRLQTAVIELKEDRETYLVSPALRPTLAAEATFKPKLLVTAMNRAGTVFLWELNLPRADGRTDLWSRTALEAVELATKGWVRIAANLDLGAYDVYEATGLLSEPDWPSVPSFRELLRIAFKDRFIDGPDHAVLRRLRGEI